MNLLEELLKIFPRKRLLERLNILSRSAFPWAHVVSAAAQAQEVREEGGDTARHFAASEPSDVRGDDEWSTLESSVPQ